MNNLYEFHTNGNLTDPGPQPTRHPSYQSPTRFSLLWFDIRVFYVRISNFAVDNSTPEHLTLSHTPVEPDTILEINTVRCPINSEGISCTLRRHRVDKKSEEATFVSTDSIRFTGSVKFEVFDKDNLVISGLLEMSGANGCVGESNNSNHTGRRWVMNCESVMNVGTGFLKGKQVMGSESVLPTIEVYVAGCFSGTPVILTKTLQVGLRKKQRKGVLDSIPENDGPECRDDFASGHDLQIAEFRSYKPESEEDYDNLYWRQTEYMEGGDGELSWFNAGVRVGVGIGLGICVGIGIGASLLVRTYQTTTRTFKRQAAWIVSF